LKGQQVQETHRTINFCFCFLFSRFGSIGSLRAVGGMEMPSLSEIAAAYLEYLQQTVFISFDSEEEHDNHHQTNAHIDMCRSSVHSISKTVYAQRGNPLETKSFPHNDTFLQMRKESETREATACKFIKIIYTDSLLRL
jgi:hypothetical protein